METEEISPTQNPPSETTAPPPLETALPPETYDLTPPVVFYKPNPSILTQCLTCLNSSPSMRISGDHVTNPSGYCMARASFPTVKGSWYYEVEIVESPPLNDEHLPSPHWRLGYSTEKGDKECPVGYDIYSYSWRDDGTLFHQARPYTWYLKKKGVEHVDSMCQGYGPGDILGFLIHVTEDYVPEEPRIQPVEPKTEPLEVMRGSSITLFKNGVAQPTRFQNLYKGQYYPAVSLYYHATVKVNFGPSFVYPPSSTPFEPTCKLNQMCTE